MDGEEDVPSLTVIRVLQNQGVFVTLVDEGTQRYVIEKGDVLEEVVLSGPIGKRYLNYLKRRLGIPIHLFWNP